MTTTNNKSALTIARAMYIEGRHLQTCFIARHKQDEGRQMANRARRIIRKLGWKPEAVL